MQDNVSLLSHKRKKLFDTCIYIYIYVGTKYVWFNLNWIVKVENIFCDDRCMQKEKLYIQFYFTLIKWKLPNWLYKAYPFTYHLWL